MTSPHCRSPRRQQEVGVTADSSSPGAWPGIGIEGQSCGRQQHPKNMVGKTATAAPGCTERHHPRTMAVYELDVNAGDHCGLQACILENTHKQQMWLRIVSSLTDRSYLTLKPTTHNHVSCYRKQLCNTGSQLHMYINA
jgi:hypothetical protein